MRSCRQRKDPLEGRVKMEDREGEEVRGTREMRCRELGGQM